MKIRVVSDLHLEFSDINIVNDGCDVLILSGDILVAEDLHNHPEMNYGMYSSVNLEDLGRRQQTALRFRDFLRRCSDQFPHVIYIAGNHEFYHGNWIASLDYLREECSKFSNIYFLENECKEIGEFTFVGSTLWTDCNRGDPITLYTLQNGMNDYRIIRHDGHGYTKLRPAHTIDRHRASLKYIGDVIDSDTTKKYVVVTHHAPSRQSIHPRYAQDHHMNGGYASDLSEFILDHPCIKLWTHGHVHSPYDYMIGSTRVVCNPRGYEGYEETEWDINKTVEIT